MVNHAFVYVLVPIAAFLVHHAPTSQHSAWILMLLGSILMLPGYPGSKDVSVRKTVEWGIVQPMIAAGAVVMHFVALEGHPISLDLILFGIALFCLFLMSTQVVFIAYTIHEVVTDHNFRRILKQQPATLAMFMLVVFFLSVTLTEVRW